MKTTPNTATAYTPGPWSVTEDEHLVRVILQDDPRLSFGCFSKNERGRANARLIAAAPDMRAMLDEMAHAITQGIVAAAEAAETGPAAEVMRQREDRMRRAQARLSALLAKINGEG